MGLNNSIELSDLMKHKNQVLNILIIVLAFIISVNIYKKQQKEIYSLNAQKETEIKKNAEFENIGILEKKNNYFKKSLAKKDAGLIINTISSMAQELGIKIMSIRPEGDLKYKHYSMQPFELALVVPGYHDLGKFVSKIENLQDVYLIENISIKPESKGKSLLVNLRLISIVVN